MRQIRVLNKKGLFYGQSHNARGAIVEVHDDKVAAEIVKQGVAEFIVGGFPGRHIEPEPEEAVARRGPERAVSRPSR